MALRQINMIPSNIIARTILMRYLRFWGKGFVCILLLLLISYFFQARWFAKLQKPHLSDVSTTIQVSEKIDQTRLASDKIKVQIQDLFLKSKMVATMANQQYYYDILAVFAGSFNDFTWIDSLSIQRSKEKEIDLSAISIEGFSMTHDTLGLFMESLSGIQRVRDVVLVYAKKQEQTSSLLSSSTAIRFKLTCSIIKRSVIKVSSK